MKIKVSPKPSIWVIVLNYNGKRTLSACLASLYQSNWPNFEVVVVDNNSTDGSFEQAKNAFSRAHFIRNSENIGFAKANNIGIRYALEKFADYIFVLNNDTLVEKDTLKKLYQTIVEHDESGIVSPLIFKQKDVWFSGGAIDWHKMRCVHKTSTGKPRQPYESEYLSGCAMLIKKEVFKQIGLFDERFFLYYEDADFSLRASKAGYKLMVDPLCHIQHLEQSNSENPQKIYWLVLSALIFFNLHADWKQKIYYFLYNLLRKAKNSKNLLFAPTQKAKEIRRAFRDFHKISF